MIGGTDAGNGIPAGRGPGPFAPDGSPVELFRLLACHGEPELVSASAPGGAEVLELGCGAGRMTSRLAALGHQVTAVDQCPEMLAWVTDGEPVLADIETLDLARRFPVVVLPSYLVNTSDDGRRRAFLGTCRRHVTDDGVVLVQRHDPEWAATAFEGATVERDGLVWSLSDLRRRGPGLAVTVHVQAPDGRRWSQPHQARVLDDDELAAELEAAGLHLVRFRDPDRRWAEARP